MKVLIADKLSTNVRKYLDNNGFETMEDASLKNESLLQALQKHQPEIVIVRSTKVTAEHIISCPTLSLIIRAGAGYNNIDTDTASKRCIFVSNCPGKNAIAVAELVFGHLINLDRKIVDNANDFRSGIWAKKKYSKAKGLRGKTLALFGLGSIGTEVMQRAKAFGMNVTVWSVPFSKEEAEELQVTYAASPQEAVQNADVLSIHLPLVAQTRNLVDANILSLMKEDAYIINTSRGEIIDEEALLQALHTKNISVGLDVFWNEPASTDKSTDSKLCAESNVYVTHHIGASTEQATEAIGDGVVSIIRDWHEKGVVQNCVNLATNSPADYCVTIRHADQVGVLANILDLLKEMGHNVQEMENIIFNGGHAASASIQIVGQPNSSLIQQINKLPNVFSASVSKLS